MSPLGRFAQAQQDQQQGQQQDQRGSGGHTGGIDWAKLRRRLWILAIIASLLEREREHAPEPNKYDLLSTELLKHAGAPAGVYQAALSTCLQRTCKELDTLLGTKSSSSVSLTSLMSSTQQRVHAVPWRKSTVTVLDLGDEHAKETVVISGHSLTHRLPLALRLAQRCRVLVYAHAGQGTTPFQSLTNQANAEALRHAKALSSAWGNVEAEGYVPSQRKKLEQALVQTANAGLVPSEPSAWHAQLRKARGEWEMHRSWTTFSRMCKAFVPGAVLEAQPADPGRAPQSEISAATATALAAQSLPFADGAAPSASKQTGHNPDTAMIQAKAIGPLPTADRQAEELRTVLQHTNVHGTVCVVAGRWDWLGMLKAVQAAPARATIKGVLLVDPAMPRAVFPAAAHPAFLATQPDWLAPPSARHVHPPSNWSAPRGMRKTLNDSIMTAEDALFEAAARQTIAPWHPEAWLDAQSVLGGVDGANKSSGGRASRRYEPHRLWKQLGKEDARVAALATQQAALAAEDYWLKQHDAKRGHFQPKAAVHSYQQLLKHEANPATLLGAWLYSAHAHADHDMWRTKEHVAGLHQHVKQAGYDKQCAVAVLLTRPEAAPAVGHEAEPTHHAQSLFRSAMSQYQDMQARFWLSIWKDRVMGVSASTHWDCLEPASDEVAQVVTDMLSNNV